jgi:tetratricopeptide (TPR) repeat protein
MFSLKTACILGGILALTLVGGLVFFTLIEKKGSGESYKAGGTFTRLLAEFDLLAKKPEGTSPETLNSLLEGLEKKALSVESHLSVLKRRRNLARSPETAGRFIPAYGEAADRISRQFPASEPLAALAAEALFLGDRQNAGETAEAREYHLSRIREPALLPLVFCLRVLSGEMGDPQSAAEVPRGEALFAAVMNRVSEQEGEQFLVNQGSLRLLEGDITGCRVLVNALLAGRPGADALRFAAEFFYDFGDPLRGAELFSRFSDEKSLARQADALWLAGQKNAARNIWRSIALSKAAAPENRERISRSLYNLAATAPDSEEAGPWLERLFAESPAPAPALTCGILLYTRLLDHSRATAILEEQDLKNEGLFDLELVKRGRDFWTLDRTVAELWLLLGRHPRDERLYQWAAYYFERQKRYDETAVLLRTAGYNGLEGGWIPLTQGIRLIREGRLDEGEARLRELSGASWLADANIARVLEARRSNAEALEYYEAAFSRLTDKKEAARIQLSIARCLRSLGRNEEIRRVLESAGELDPENLTVRLELRRLL